MVIGMLIRFPWVVRVPAAACPGFPLGGRTLELEHILLDVLELFGPKVLVQ